MAAGSWINMEDLDLPFQVYDYAIGGKMVVGRTIVHDALRELLQDGDPAAKKLVKSAMTTKMVEYMLENKLVEFTYHTDKLTGHTQVQVRAYLAPDDQIKILRSINKL